MCELRTTPLERISLRTPVRLGGCLAKLPNGHGGWVDALYLQTDVDLEILDLLLREGPKSAYRLAGALTRAGEVLGTDAVRERLRALASRGLVAGSASGHRSEERRVGKECRS